MLAVFLVFLCLEAAFLLTAMIYVSPLISRGARRVDAPPVVLPMAIVKPAAWRRARGE